MRKYVEDTTQRWRVFQAEYPQDAAEIKKLIFSVCTDMTSNGRKKQIEAMRTSDQFENLRGIAIRHSPALGIRDDTDRELALWIRTICFCDVMKQERVD